MTRKRARALATSNATIEAAQAHANDENNEQIRTGERSSNRLNKKKTLIDACTALILLKRAVARHQGQKYVAHCFLLTESNKSDVHAHHRNARSRASKENNEDDRMRNDRPYRCARSHAHWMPMRASTHSRSHACHHHHSIEREINAHKHEHCDGREGLTDARMQRNDATKPLPYDATPRVAV